jgi:hypothetical protein
MLPQKENPARAARGCPVTDLANGSITPEFRSQLIHLQVAHLTGRCAIAPAMAAIVAPLVYGEGTQ